MDFIICQCVQLLCSSQATIIHIIFRLTCTVIGRTGEMNANEGIFVTEFVYYNEKIKINGKGGQLLIGDSIGFLRL